MKILLATQKPFSPVAVEGMKNVANAENELILLENYKQRSELDRAVADTDALIVRSDAVARETIDVAANLKIVVRAGAGYDNVDLDACSERGIVVMNTPGQNANAVAELVLGLTVYMARNSFSPGTGGELRGKSLGIHAYGNVGRLVASLGAGFGMTVFAFDPFVTDETMNADGVTALHSAEDLYARCDVVSVNIPALPATVKSVNRTLLGRMRRNAILVNTARKEVIDEEALLEAMKNSSLRYAADVRPDRHEEMSAFGHRYFATPKKIGAETEEANVNAALAAVNQIIDFFKTGNQRFRVNG